MKPVVACFLLFGLFWFPRSLAAPPPPGLPVPVGRLTESKKIGLRLIERYRKGKLRLVNDARDKAQIKQIAYRGYITGKGGKPVFLSLALLRTLDHLSLYASPQKPMALLSLYRPPTALRSRSAHGRGAAVDLWAYGGYTINSRDPKECTDGVLAVIKALPPMRQYRLGLPRPPNTDPQGLRPPPRRPKTWPFFPAPLPRIITLFGSIRVVMPRRDAKGHLLLDRRRGYLQPEIIRWQNERGAPLSEVGSARVRRALQDAQRRGAAIHALFPDAADHLHLDVL